MVTYVYIYIYLSTPRVRSSMTDGTLLPKRDARWYAPPRGLGLLRPKGALSRHKENRSLMVFC